MNSTAAQHCGKCASGYYLDLSTYTCVLACPNMTFPITSYNVKNNVGTPIKYCRPYQSVNNYTYYVNANSTSYFGLGTYEHPFQSINSASMEIYNFMYTKLTNVTMFIARNTTISFY
jgi:hypothetical protein